MTLDNSSVRSNESVVTILPGGRWIAFSGFVYVVAWIAGLIIGFVTSSPAPTDSAATIGAYFSSHREVAMIQAYLLDGIAGIALIVFASALCSALLPITLTTTLLSLLQRQQLLPLIVAHWAADTAATLLTVRPE